MSQLPNWAVVVQALDVPRTAAQLKELGIKQADVLDAEQGGHVTRSRQGSNVLYSSTFKGRRSYSVVKTEEVIAHYRAQPSVATPASAPSKERYNPPQWGNDRPGADAASKIPSRGM